MVIVINCPNMSSTTVEITVAITTLLKLFIDRFETKYSFEK